MNERMLLELLHQVKRGELLPEEAVQRLKQLPFTDLGFAKVDHHRELRKGFPEVIFCASKTPEQVAAICRSLAEQTEGNILATRASLEAYQAVLEVVPEAQYFPLARIILIKRGPQQARGHIIVMCAGTSDIPVAEEAALTAEAMGNKVERIYDVGVSGLHRLLQFQDSFAKARVFVVVAGMEGALPSVVAGLVDKPVIAVPTSVGYGASFGGLAALLGMLNSCASGVSVVNIDNGFGAGYQASLINRLGG